MLALSPYSSGVTLKFLYTITFTLSMSKGAKLGPFGAAQDRLRQACPEHPSRVLREPQDERLGYRSLS